MEDYKKEDIEIQDIIDDITSTAKDLVIVHDDDKPLMISANLLSLVLERGWLKGTEDEYLYC